MKTLKKTFMLVTMMVMAITFIACGSKSASGQKETENSSASTDGAALENTTWEYFRTEDDLTHEVTGYTAYIVSKNRCRFDGNNNTARMAMSLCFSTMYTSDPCTSVLFNFTEDNKMCRLSSFQGSGILAIFDDGEVDDRWGLINTTEKRNCLFMFYPNKVAPFVEKLKNSKQVRIQVNLENVGRTTFDFDVSGLKWEWPK